MKDTFIELLQVAMGTRNHLSECPSAVNWEELLDEAERQAISGVLFHGIERLPVGQRPPLENMLQWVGTAQIIQTCNENMDKRCLELLAIMKKRGLHGTILKGQGLARLYDTQLVGLRQSGDIDVYTDCGIEKSLHFAHLVQEEVSWDFKHLHLEIWDDVEVELHYRVEWIDNLIKNRRLQRWFKEHEDMLFEEKEHFITPNISFNVFYILLHIYRHFFTEGVGLRQLMDYYYVLKAKGRNHNPKIATDAISDFGMERFARGVMWIMEEVFGLDRDYLLFEPHESEGQYILQQVLEGGNFGYYSSNRSQLGGGVGFVINRLRQGVHLIGHYPQESLWIPIWIIWHKGWKIWKVISLKLMT